ncbi:MAG: signal peptidase I [Bacillota bacterium]|nr:signal peptidase I [Bacillota bacterium]
MRGVRLWLARFILHPGVLLRDMKASVPMWPSLAIAWLGWWATGTYFAEVLLPGIEWLPAYVLTGAPVGLVILLLFLGVLHLVARTLRGRGRISDLARLWGYTYLPETVIGVILAIVLRFTVFRGSPPGSPQGCLGPGWLVGIVVVALITAIWSLVLRIQVLRVTYGHGVLMAVLVLVVFEAATDVVGWAPQLALKTVGARGVTLAGLMDPMDERVARDIRVIREKEASFVGGSEVTTGVTYVPINVRAFPPKRGDVVVFCRDDHTRRDLRRPFIAINLGLGGDGSQVTADVGVARVVGLPGETVEVKGGRVLVNGEELDEPYVKAPGNIDLPPVEVPEDSFFLLGDRRSIDPATYGAGVVARQKILGGLLRTWTDIFIPLVRALVFG